MRHALLLILFTTLATAGEAEAVKLDPKLPPTVVAEMKDYQSDIDKIEAKAKADKTKRAAELAKLLEKAETDTTKKGDLEAALAVKAALEALPLDKMDELGNKVPAPQVRNGAAEGIAVKTATGVISVWDNAAALSLDTDPHTLDFVLHLPQPAKTLYLRSAPTYGSDRIGWSMNGGAAGIGKVFTFALPAGKKDVKLVGTHTGSNDAFQYGPMQYKTTPDGEWENIPASLITTK